MYPPSDARRSLAAVYFVWLFLGLFGGHRFYLSRTGSGFLYLCTGGLFLVGWICDGFALPRLVGAEVAQGTESPRGMNRRRSGRRAERFAATAFWGGVSGLTGKRVPQYVRREARRMR
ncbi:TM2 domain-containing protein [Curtobacterium sp. MCBD17_013]|uniref:TM2 domain-containing protein n=1 Tax=Curtobacterium sp. MCBD17_013 TaxID=2175668 RepID=UPI0035C8E208